MKAVKPKDYFAGANLNIAHFVPRTSQRVLEIGCAEGALGESLRSELKCEVWGIELDPEAGKIAEGRLDKVLCKDIEALESNELPLDYFDCLILGDVIEHLLDPERTLRKLLPHLQMNAVLVANVPNIAHWSVVTELLKGEFTYSDSGLLDRTHRTFFTPRSFEKLLWDSGYRVTQQEPFLVPSDATTVLADASRVFGLDPDACQTTLNTYQTLFQAKLQPCPERQPDKRALLTRSIVSLQAGVPGKVSIIIVTYESASTIEDCLASLLRTKLAIDEIIVVDNGSQDATVDLVSRLAVRDPSIQLIRNGENLGFSKANNVGVVASSGETIVFANPDTVFFPGWRESFCKALADPKCGAVGPLSDVVAGQQNVAGYPEISPGTAETIAKEVASKHARELRETKMLIGFCLATRREVLQEAGLFDEAMFLGAEDLECSWRLRCLGYNLQIALDVFVEHRHHVSFSSLGESQAKEYIQASDSALTEKLKEYYEGLHGLSSQNLWGSKIFSEALCR